MRLSSARRNRTVYLSIVYTSPPDKINMGRHSMIFGALKFDAAISFTTIICYNYIR